MKYIAKIQNLYLVKFCTFLKIGIEKVSNFFKKVLKFVLKIYLCGKLNNKEIYILVKIYNIYFILFTLLLFLTFLFV